VEYEHDCPTEDEARQFAVCWRLPQADDDLRWRVCNSVARADRSSSSDRPGFEARLGVHDLGGGARSCAALCSSTCASSRASARPSTRSSTCSPHPSAYSRPSGGHSSDPADTCGAALVLGTRRRRRRDRHSDRSRGSRHGPLCAVAGTMLVLDRFKQGKGILELLRAPAAAIEGGLWTAVRKPPCGVVSSSCS
jgi:hypothetical protein